MSTLVDALLEKPFDGSEAVPSNGLRDNSRPSTDIFDADLCSLESVIVRQDTKFLESIAQTVGIPYEAKQVYRVSNLDLPADRRVALSPGDPQKMVVNNTALYNDSRMPLLLAREQSSFLTRCCLSLVGGLHLRPFVMHVHELGHHEHMTEERTLFRRPCRIGAKCFGGVLAVVLGFAIAAAATAAYAVLALQKSRSCGARGAADSDSDSGSGSDRVSALCDTPWLEFHWLGLVVWGSWLAGILLCLPCSCFGGYRCRKRMRFEMQAELSVGGSGPASSGGRKHSVNSFVYGETGEVYGRVVEKTEPYAKMLQQCCCYCTFYDEIYEETPVARQHVFTTRMNYCCCGRVNNCCGATCCKHDFIVDILDPDTNEVVATIQRTYAAGEGCDACCRCIQQFQTYL
jgi:hypothetical protein